MPSNHLILCHCFSTCPLSFPASGSFQMRWLFASGGQSTGASALVLLMNIPLFLCIDRWGRLSYLLLFFGTLHSDAYIFPFLLCFPLLFFSQLFVRPPQTAILLFCISFPRGWSRSLSHIQCHEPPSCECLRVSHRGMGQQWPAAGMGTGSSSLGMREVVA